MELHSRFGSFLKTKTKFVKRLHAARAVDSAASSQKESVEACVSGSSAEMLTKHFLLLVSGLELASRDFCITSTRWMCR